MVWIIGGVGMMVVGLMLQNGALVLVSFALAITAVTARIVKGIPSSTQPPLGAVRHVSASMHIDSHEQQLYHRLLVMAHGDAALAERLIGYEATCRPDRVRAELIDAAIGRWIRDMNGWR